MVDQRTPLDERSLRFAVGMFQGTANAVDAQTCEHSARAARGAAATSDHPLLCVARAAWWAAVADAAQS
ncbi:MAG: hypothetical protein LC799_19185 [Actinobacteria bacterium]|nr:hypothetical protein [Actinomycetota bacterium]